MKIYVRDRNEALISWIQKANLLYQVPDLQAHVGNPWNDLQTETDAIVSPANSFGFMDGGIDHYYIKVLGEELGIEVQKIIKTSYPNGLLIGQAFLVSTSSDKVKNLIVAPTMRVPRPITDLNDVVLASRAAMSVALQYNLQSVAFPGMGTGVGNVPFDDAARAMLKGIKEALNPPPFPTSILEAYNRQIRI